MAQQTTINYFLPSQIEFGVGVIANLAAHVTALDGKKPLLVTDEGVMKAGLVPLLLPQLDEAEIKYIVLDTV